MYAEFQAGFSALKSALELAKAGKDAIDRVALANALSEVQTRLMEAQTAALGAMEENLRLAQRLRVLEDAASKADDWEAEVAKHVLTDVGGGVSVYTEAERTTSLRSAVKLCANCFGLRTKSILQLQRADVRHQSLVCLRCNAKLLFRTFADYQSETPAQ